MEALLAGRLDWNRDGADWPHRAASRFVTAGGLSWHVQIMGEGPAILLLHGTGAATHSWRGLMPLLATHHTVVAPDLPGHGFTDNPENKGYSLTGMARSVAALLAALDMRPELIVGHSAGAAIAIRMVLDRLVRPKAIVSINGALSPPRGIVGPFFSPIAKMLALNPVVPRIFAWQARTGASVDRLLDQTGSRIDETGADFYRRLVRDPGHVAGALGMMANWDLKSLVEAMPRLDVPLVLVVGGDDRMVPAEDAFATRRLVRGASVVYMRGLGHLAHEEAPARFATLIERVARGEPPEPPSGETQP